MLLLNEKNVTSLCNMERKKLYARVAKISGKTESSIHEIVKKEKQIPASFSIVPQTIKVMAAVCGMCLVKMEKSLNLCRSRRVVCIKAWHCIV
jgi:hypothetical protein